MTLYTYGGVSLHEPVCPCMHLLRQQPCSLVVVKPGALLMSALVIVHWT